jgi:lipopolysaccharide export system protein LptA
MIARFRLKPRALPRITGLALAFAGMLTVVPAVSAPPAKGVNSNAPVNYTADRIEVQDRANRVVLSGNVDVTQDTMRLRSARVTVSYTNNGSLKIQQMVATGSVYVTRGTDTARGDVAVYDLVSKIITMSGNVTVDRNGDTLHGGRAVMNLTTGMSTIDSRPSGTAPGPGTNGRVSGTFTVAQGK